MPGTITHQFVSVLPDDPDATLVRPSNWNETHDFNLTGPDVGLPVGGDITGQPNNIAVGLDSVSTGAYSIAIGELSSAVSAYSIAVGYQASASATASFALGAYSQATFTNSIALGDSSVTGRTYEFSVGDVLLERYVANVKAGTLGTDAVNLSQLTASKITGSIDIDFGASPGLNQTSVVVTGQTNLLAGSDITVSVYAIATADNTIDDIKFLASLIGLSAGTIVAGDRFTIYATSTQKIEGLITLNYAY
jgi:hypothetical protein